MKLVYFALITYVYFSVIEFETDLLSLELITLKVIHHPEFEKISGSINKMHLALYSFKILNVQKSNNVMLKYYH